MRLPTYEELENKVRRDLDLLDADNFVGNEEMVGYFNEAIEDAESEIMSLNQDYFLKEGTAITLVNGQSSYNLPSDIYAQKLRGLVYSNGPKIYPLTRVRDPYEFYKREEMDYYATSESEYAYMLTMGTEGVQAKIELTPTPREDGAYLKNWYIRKAARIPYIGDTVNGSPATRSTQLATVVDIPEWTDYLIQFVKCRCYEKEMDPRLPAALEALANRKKMLVESLAEKLPDNQDQIPLDMEFYYEHN